MLQMMTAVVSLLECHERVSNNDQPIHLFLALFQLIDAEIMHPKEGRKEFEGCETKLCSLCLLFNLAWDPLHT